MAKRYVDHTDDPDKLARVKREEVSGRSQDFHLLTKAEQEAEDAAIALQRQDAEWHAAQQDREIARTRFFKKVIEKMAQFRLTTVGDPDVDEEVRRRMQLPKEAPKRPIPWPQAWCSCWDNGLLAGSYILCQFNEKGVYKICLRHTKTYETLQLQVRVRAYNYTYYDTREGKGRAEFGKVDEEHFTNSIARLLFEKDLTLAKEFVLTVRQTLLLTN